MSAMSRMSRGWWMRTVFLGLPILWLVVVTLMLVNLTFDNMSGTSGDVRQGIGHRHGYQRPERADEIVKARPEHRIQANILDGSKVVHKMNRENHNFTNVKRQPEFQLKDGRIQVLPKDTLENKHIVSTKYHLKPENDFKQSTQVVDVSDLTNIPEIKRLAPILKPAAMKRAPGMFLYY